MGINRKILKGILKTKDGVTGRDFEVCYPHCVFKLQGEVNSVKNTTMNIWLNDGVY